MKMLPDMLIIDEDTVNLLSYASIEPEWFDKFRIPNDLKSRVKRVEIDNKIYLISKNIKNSRLLFIKIADRELFTGLDSKDQEIAFDRIITIALSQFGGTVAPGKTWGKYAQGQRLSIYATSRSKQGKERIYFDTSPQETDHLYAYALVESNNGFDDHIVDEDAFIDAFDKVDQAISAEWQTEKEDNTRFGIELTERLVSQYGESVSLQQWYENKLTNEQRTFVDKGYEDPVRLKGAAGTGKTVALTVKILRDAFQFEEKKEEKRLLFITHSFATAQLVEEVIRSMDYEKNWKELKHVKLKIASLYDFAQELLNYDLKTLSPLSVDGKEGRKVQYEILESVLVDKLKDARFRIGLLGKCSKDFENALTHSEKRKNMLLEILNEFACVLDAENIVKGSDKEQKYLTGARESWQMHLPEKNERAVILDLHVNFREFLRDLNVLSMDQMIADLNRYLMSHEWNHICSDEGYDGVFVDELHCFTRPERMVFHELFRKNKSFDNKKLPLFMAYDIKQSVDDNFIYSVRTDSGSSLIGSTNVGKTELVELTQVFRYTPEIANFLSDLDGAFPALDLSSEWGQLTLKTEQQKGGLPELTVYNDEKKLIDSVFSQANKQTRRLSGKKTVAVLCTNFDLFQKYLGAGRIRHMYLPLSSRDEVTKLTKLKGKCIFSMPEYVAGLQFDIVYFIHLDKIEVDEDNPSCGAYRRFVSRAYLGASRAKEELHISACESRQGYSKILQPALDSGSLTTK